MAKRATAPKTTERRGKGKRDDRTFHGRPKRDRRHSIQRARYTQTVMSYCVAVA